MMSTLRTYSEQYWKTYWIAVGFAELLCTLDISTKEPTRWGDYISTEKSR